MGTQSAVSREAHKWMLGRKLVLLAVLAYLVAFGMGRVVLAHGESVPYTMFWRAPSGALVSGAYVMLEMSHPIIGPKPALLTKRLMCDEGDELRFEDEAFFCNGQRLGGYISRTWDDKPLTPFQFEGKIPAGFAFVMGSHPRSFDSRYFGLVEKSRLTRLRALL